ncbi:MAG TPA: 50S ribosomal protein L21 [Candidatus Caccalectryoclostridium excrementigallinarum]|uniref:Large ribosomal subunit protein bL21 n=1 Tax=Candidatus Caccalectryoclostridium excrementigallinarum TaxID=2840710 RepID=A0A9D1MLL9_9FIRM|nr:50S ribosomal protein L21 [Candidatus Caccalectryoclostridium excrementigallinarum]
MYAIIATGGKQYKAEAGQTIKVEKIKANVGDVVDLEALMIVDGDKIVVGEAAKSAAVKAEVVAQEKDKKIVIFKYKSKKNVRKRQGHRQPYTALKIKEIAAQ